MRNGHLNSVFVLVDAVGLGHDGAERDTCSIGEMLMGRFGVAWGGFNHMQISEQIAVCQHDRNTSAFFSNPRHLCAAAGRTRNCKVEGLAKEREEFVGVDPISRRSSTRALCEEGLERWIM